VTAPPEGARDVRVPVDGAELRARRYRRAGRPTLLRFHGNGEVVSDDDAVVPEFARVGFDLTVVVFESGFLDLAGLVRRRGPSPPTAFSDDELEAFDGVRKLRRGRAPLLVLHGAEDRAISADEAREAHRLTARPPGTSTSSSPPGRGHSDVSASPVYRDAFALVRARPTR
jgi:pimeloyl-ACP methyl ester carboxylesterase